MDPRVELVSTGAELLNGRTVNRHAQVLGERLASLGLALVRDTTLPDDQDTIADALQQALDRVDVVITSGGLGPTSDDVTRDAIAAHLGRAIVSDPASLRTLRERYAKWNRTLTPARERQAQIVEGAVALSNPVGAAPGQRIELKNKVVFVLPGPPREFAAILDQHVLPWLTNQFGERELAREHIFLVTGLGESDIVALFEEAGFPPPGVTVTYCAAPARVEIRLTTEKLSPAAWEDASSRVRALLGNHVYAEERTDLPEVVGRALTGRGATVAVAESCSGGLLAHRITSVSGSSAYFLGGVVSYANDAKVRDLGVSAVSLEQHGAVSEQVAREMAAGVRERFGSDFGISITGIAGPSGGTDEKPVGLVFIAIADVEGSYASRHQFPGDRAWIKEWSSLTALDMLRLHLLGRG